MSVDIDSVEKLLQDDEHTVWWLNSRVRLNSSTIQKIIDQLRAQTARADALEARVKELEEREIDYRLRVDELETLPSQLIVHLQQIVIEGYTLKFKHGKQLEQING